MRKPFLALLALLLVWGPARSQQDPGPWLVFASGRTGNVDIYKMSVSTRALRRLTTSQLREDQPVWSWDGSQIAYRIGGDVWTIQADGLRPVNRTPGTSSTMEWFPFWMPDGRLGFTSNVSGTEKLYLLQSSGQWTPFNLAGHVAAVSPDGRRICYTRSLEVYWAQIYPPPTGPEYNISQHPTSDHMCAWDPHDPFYLLIHSHRPAAGETYGSGRIWLVDRTGIFYPPPVTQGAQERYDKTEGDVSPTWHSSGWIAWARPVGCTPDVWCYQQFEKTELFARTPAGKEIRLTWNGVEDRYTHFKP